MFATKKNIFNCTKKDLENFIKDKEIKKFRKNQIWNWLYVQGITSFFDMKNLSQETQKLLDRNFSIDLLETKESYTSEDGTKKMGI